jgi:transcriptional activator of cad operon
MERPTTTILRVGDWRLDPVSGDISRGEETARLDARTLRLLLCLAEHAGEVVSIDDLLNQVWSGVIVTPDSVYQAVASLRRVLGDDPKQPSYIATVPRLGYRMIARVGPWSDGSGQARSIPDRPISDHPAAGQFIAHADTLQSANIEASAQSSTGPPAKTSRVRIGFALAIGTALCLGLGIALRVYLYPGTAATHYRPPSADPATPPQNSIAVLPILDLTEGMKNEEFADGITEELIDKLSKIPGLSVPSPTSSFYFKGKNMPVADIAKSLGVVYVLDGSVRKSGTWVRVDVRLTRADNGYIAWSETYDQPMSDILTIQDDIAGKVVKALKASIAAGPANEPSR